ncbi:uncharacterized protein [Dermacentor andersoni]|uniref:uncharacterized protein n=1 Tax=Dermacentor andersoni TaxID=34620 RepID=UPI003B3BAE3D
MAVTLLHFSTLFTVFAFFSALPNRKASSNMERYCQRLVPRSIRSSSNKISLLLSDINYHPMCISVRAVIPRHTPSGRSLQGSRWNALSSWRNFLVASPDFNLQGRHLPAAESASALETWKKGCRFS